MSLMVFKVIFLYRLNFICMSLKIPPPSRVISCFSPSSPLHYAVLADSFLNVFFIPCQQRALLPLVLKAGRLNVRQ